MHIYLSDLTKIYNTNDLLSKINADEYKKYLSFHRKIRANQFLVAHAIKNDICNKFKYISISHKDNLVVVAASDYPIGIDIEKISEKRDWKLMAEFMGIKNIDSCMDFYKQFTLAEARFKMGNASIVNKMFYKTGEYIICVASGHKNLHPKWHSPELIPEQIQ